MNVWPLPALLAWAAAWGVFLGLLSLGAAPVLAVGIAATIGAILARLGTTRARRWVIGGGFPASLVAALAAGSLPAWGWLLAAVALVAIYPLRAWRDAPIFPTPRGALAGAQAATKLAQPRVLDAGCGAGDGLIELQREWPGAQLHGVESSAVIAALARIRCRGARIVRGDLWTTDWSGFDLVYLFQRPESMARAHAKASAELKAGAWLASLEFSVPGVAPTRVLPGADGRALYLYRL